MSNRRVDSTPTPSTPRTIPPWFSASTTYPSPSSSSATQSPSRTSTHPLLAQSVDELSIHIVMEEIDSTSIPTAKAHEAEQLKISSAVLPPVTVHSPQPPPSHTSSGDGRLQLSSACADMTGLLDVEEGEVVILGDDNGSSDEVDALCERGRSLDCSGVVCQGRAPPLPSPVQVAVSTSATCFARPSIATKSTSDKLLAIPSPSVELSKTGIVGKPSYSTTAPVSDQRPREKKRKAVDDPEPSIGSVSMSFKKARMEHEIPRSSPPSAPAASSMRAPPRRNFILKTTPPPKRRSPPATRAPRSPTRPISHPSIPSAIISTAGQSQNLKRKRDEDAEEGGLGGSGAPTGCPSTSARDPRPASKKPKTYCSLGATRTPTSAQTIIAHTGHLRSAADLAHKRWEERMKQQQQGGRMRVVSTDLLAMRAKVRRPRATNVSR